MAERDDREFPFSVLCDKICQNKISDKELRILKRRIKGVVKGNLQLASTPTEFFSLLEEYKCFEENTYIFIILQEVFKQITRHELRQIVTDYCRHKGTVAYIQDKNDNSQFVTVICPHIQYAEQCYEIVSFISCLLCVDKLYLIIKGDGDRLYYHDGDLYMKEFHDIHACSGAKSDASKLLVDQRNCIELLKKHLERLQHERDHQSQNINKLEKHVQHLQRENDDLKQKNKSLKRIAKIETRYSYSTCQI